MDTGASDGYAPSSDYSELSGLVVVYANYLRATTDGIHFERLARYPGTGNAGSFSDCLVAVDSKKGSFQI